MQNYSCIRKVLENQQRIRQWCSLEDFYGEIFCELLVFVGSGIVLVKRRSFEWVLKEPEGGLNHKNAEKGLNGAEILIFSVNRMKTTSTNDAFTQKSLNSSISRPPIMKQTKSRQLNQQKLIKIAMWTCGLSSNCSDSVARLIKPKFNLILWFD